MRGKVWVVPVFAALLGVAACDAPTDPARPALDAEAELVSVAYERGLSCSPIKGVYTIRIGDMLYDIGCPLQCWLPEGIVTLVREMRDDGSLRILGGAVPMVYVAGVKVPVFLQNARPVPQCMNGRDDDGDGLTDYPADPGCTCAEDEDEYNEAVPQCSNGIDDDGDELVDYPEDPGCVSPVDDNEFDVPPIDIKIAPLLTSPVFIRGTVPTLGLKEWFVSCPIRGTLVTQDARTWTPLGVMFDMKYVRWLPGEGWVMGQQQGMDHGNRPDIAGNILTASGWMHKSKVANHEVKYTMKMLVRGSDGEELWVWANGGAEIFCGL